MDNRKAQPLLNRKAICIAPLCHKRPDGDKTISPPKCLGCNDLVVKKVAKT